MKQAELHNSTGVLDTWDAGHRVWATARDVRVGETVEVRQAPALPVLGVARVDEVVGPSTVVVVKLRRRYYCSRCERAICDCEGKVEGGAPIEPPRFAAWTCCGKPVEVVGLDVKCTGACGRVSR